MLGKLSRLFKVFRMDGGIIDPAELDDIKAARKKVDRAKNEAYQALSLTSQAEVSLRKRDTNGQRANRNP